MTTINVMTTIEVTLQHKHVKTKYTISLSKFKCQKIQSPFQN